VDNRIVFTGIGVSDGYRRYAMFFPVGMGDDDFFMSQALQAATYHAPYNARIYAEFASIDMNVSYT
jgi:hypothetical protein